MITSKDLCLPTRKKPPLVAEQFDVTFGTACCGWIDMTITWDGGSFELPTSYVCDPYIDMKTWLELVAQGSVPCFSINPEGSIVYFVLAEDGEKGAIRLTIWVDACWQIESDDEQVSFVVDGVSGSYQVTVKACCDLILPRRKFIAAFYKGLLDRWERPDPETFWREWDNTTPEQWEEDHNRPYGTWHFPMQSDVIGAYLAATNDGRGDA